MILPKSAETFATEVTQFLQGSTDIEENRITEFIFMRDMGWTKAELNVTPMCDVLSVLLIMNCINIQAEKGNHKQQ